MTTELTVLPSRWIGSAFVLHKRPLNKFASQLLHGQGDVNPQKALKTIFNYRTQVISQSLFKNA